MAESVLCCEAFRNIPITYKVNQEKKGDMDVRVVYDWCKRGAGMA